MADVKGKVKLLRRVEHMEAPGPPWWCAIHVRQQTQLGRAANALLRCPSDHLFLVERKNIDDRGWTIPQACPTCQWGGIFRLEGWAA